jgi:hypothetical protein
MTATPADPREPRPVVPRTTPASGGADVLAPALDRLLAVRADGLAPLTAWDSAGALMLVHEVPAGAVTLTSLREVGPLRSGHVLHVARSVCSALVALHAAGLAHGAVGAERVLVAPDGDVVLAATGAAWTEPPGTPLGPRPADDVLALGELVRLLLGRGAAPGSLVIAALRAVDADPLLRPDAAALRDLLGVCGRSEPLLGPLWGAPAGAGDEPPPPTPPGDAGPGSAPRPVPRQRRRPGRAARARSADAAAAAVAAGDPDQPVERPPRRGRRAALRARRLPLVLTSLAALLVGALAFRAAPLLGAAAETVPSSPVSSSAPAVDLGLVALDPVAPTDWAAVVAGLDAGRRQALASGSEDELARWVDRQGRAWAADAALLQRLAASGASLSGGELELESVEVQAADDVRAVLDVRDRRGSYDIVVDGAVQHVAERATSRWTLTLTRADGVWRIADVVPAGSGA